jgi:hypothetical protein
VTAPRTPGGDSWLEVHRLLDEAFSGIEMTPERQDMKEEIRANLVSRVAELREGGLDAAEAARRAVENLGDIRAVLDDTDPGPATPVAAGAAGAGSPTATPAARPPSWARLGMQQRVRPRPAFLVRTVLLSFLGLTGLAVLALDATTALDARTAGRLAAVVAVALATGAITADSLRQETTVHHPMPTPRACGYGAVAALALAGAGLGWQYVPDRAVGWLVAGAVPLLGAVLAFTYLAGSQTNRTKAWVLHQGAAAQFEDRFSQDPVAAARFGMYTVVTWLVAIVAFVVLTLTVGWAWSWTALVAGCAATMLTLARMLFGPHQGPAPQ